MKHRFHILIEIGPWKKQFSVIDIYNLCPNHRTEYFHIQGDTGGILNVIVRMKLHFDIHCLDKGDRKTYESLHINKHNNNECHLLVKQQL